MTEDSLYPHIPQEPIPLLPIILSTILAFLGFLLLGIYLIRRFRSTLFPPSSLVNLDEEGAVEAVMYPVRPDRVSWRKGGRRRRPTLGARTQDGPSSFEGQARRWVIDGESDEESVDPCDTESGHVVRHLHRTGDSHATRKQLIDLAQSFPL